MLINVNKLRIEVRFGHSNLWMTCVIISKSARSLIPFLLEVCQGSTYLEHYLSYNTNNNPYNIITAYIDVVIMAVRNGSVKHIVYEALIAPWQWEYYIYNNQKECVILIWLTCMHKQPCLIPLKIRCHRECSTCRKRYLVILLGNPKLTLLAHILWHV